MPKFRRPESAIVRTTLPRRNENEPEMRLDANEDIKISLVFSGSKLIIPMILLFDSKHKKSLSSLTVTFSHDDFDIINLKYDAQCKSTICGIIALISLKTSPHPILPNLTALTIYFLSRYRTNCAPRSPTSCPNCFQYGIPMGSCARQ